VTPVQTFDGKGRLRRSDVTPALFMRRVTIPDEESYGGAGFALMATPDRVPGVVIPSDALLLVGYKALYKNGVANSGRAAIFLGENQAVYGAGAAAPASQSAVGLAEADDYGILTTGETGLHAEGGAGAASNVGTGQILGSGASSGVTWGGLTAIFADPGTYDVSVRFRVGGGGLVTVKERDLWVAVLSARGVNPELIDGDSSVGEPVVQAADYVLGLGDAGKAVEIDSPAARVVTVPAAADADFRIGTIIEVGRRGAGAVTIAAAAGVTLRSRGGFSIGDQWGAVSLRKSGPSEWWVVGDLV
jgi:hypothetical protein